eukprot:1841579-Prymnesium_polylepis.1
MHRSRVLRHPPRAQLARQQESILHQHRVRRGGGRLTCDVARERMGAAVQVCGCVWCVQLVARVVPPSRSVEGGVRVVRGGARPKVHRGRASHGHAARRVPDRPVWLCGCGRDVCGTPSCVNPS